MKRGLVLFAVVALLPLIGCGRERGAQKLSVEAEPADVSLVQGESATVKLKVERTEFEGDVTVKIHDLPKGVSVEGSDEGEVTVGKGEDKMILTIKATKDALVGEDMVAHFKATGGDVETKEKELYITVTAPDDTMEAKLKKWRDTLQKKWASAKTEIDEGMTTLKKQGKELSKDAKKKYDAAMKDLKSRYEELQKQAAEMAETSGEKWEDYSEQMSKSMMNLRKDIQQRIEEFKKNVSNG